MVNDVGFVIAEKGDLASGPGTRLDHLCSRVLQRKLLTYTSEGG